jgi:intracellular multiplication protein IcmN
MPSQQPRCGKASGIFKEKYSVYMSCRIIPCVFFSFAIAICFFVGGCTSNPRPYNPEVIRSIELTRLSNQLEASGARVTRTGEWMRVILFSDDLFNPHSANFVAMHPRVLNALAKLMKNLETVSVRVSAYTDAEPTQLQNKSLSTAQAQTVADYVWSKGLDARMFYSVGYGFDSAHTNLFGSYSQRLKRRVEVEFEYLPLLSSVAY